MPSTLALIGGAEFTPGNETLDHYLLERAGGVERTRGLIIPTAAAQENPYRAARNGTFWFQSLGVTMDNVMIVDRVTADYRHFVALIERANFFYLLGGDPRYLLDTLRDSKAWRVIAEKYRAGEAVVAGSSAGAMVLASWMADSQGDYIPALNLTPAPILVAPHFSPESRVEWKNLPGDAHLFGIPERTGAVFDGEEWIVLGSGEVIVMEANRQVRGFKNGERFRLM